MHSLPKPSREHPRDSRAGRAGRLALPILTLLLPLALASGCGSTGSRGPRPSTLSDAARQTEPDGGRKRPLVVREKKEEETAPVAIVVVRDQDERAHHRHPSRPLRPRARERYQPDLRFYFGASWLGGRSDLEPEARIRGGALTLGVDADRRVKAEMELTYRRLEPLDGYARDPFRDEEEWLLGANLRFLLATPRQALRPYILLGGNVGQTHWRYPTPIEVVSVDDWGHPVGRGWAERDFLGTGSGYVGIGCSFLNTPNLEVGANGRFGYQFYGGTTNVGLTNDLLEEHAVATLSLELSILP